MKQLLTLFFLLLLGATTHAQLGIKAGLNSSTLRIDESELSVENKEAATGWQAGLFYRLKLSDALSVQPELLYVERKSGFDVGQSFTSARVEAETKYAEIPVVMLLQLGDLPVNLQVGGYAAYLADVEYRFNSLLSDQGMQEVDDDREGYNKSDYGFIGGLGVEFLNFTIDLRYTQGFQTQDEGFQYRNVEYLTDAKNVALMLNVGYRFW